MKNGSTGVAFWCLVVAVVVLAEAHETTAVTCNAMELSPCMSAITGSGAPSPACCAKLKEQQPCFCQYMKNPMLRPYVDSPNAKKIAATCGVATPTCQKSARHRSAQEIKDQNFPSVHRACCCFVIVFSVGISCISSCRYLETRG